jgi:hypothetical protein
MSVGLTWKVMLRRRGHSAYHYAATKRFPRVPQQGKIINVHDVDGTLVNAVIERVNREQSGRSGRQSRVFTIYADEIEA